MSARFHARPWLETRSSYASWGASTGTEARRANRGQQKARRETPAAPSGASAPRAHLVHVDAVVPPRAHAVARVDQELLAAGRGRGARQKGRRTAVPCRQGRRETRLPVFHVVANLHPHDELLVLQLGLLVRALAPRDDVPGVLPVDVVRLVVPCSAGGWLSGGGAREVRARRAAAARGSGIPVLIRNEIHASSVFRRIRDTIVARLSRTTSRKTL